MNIKYYLRCSLTFFLLFNAIVGFSSHFQLIAHMGSVDFSSRPAEVVLAHIGEHTNLVVQNTENNLVVIEGTVYDARTRETIPGVVIYLDGTSIVTTSDKDGNFCLEINNKINTNLIFSHLSYEPLVVKYPFERLEKAFFLKEKVSTLTEAVVVGKRELFTRNQMMRVFKEQFLGLSTAGKSCQIVNEEDVIFKYDQNACKLLAYAIQPLIIENKHLEYRITFHLHSFTIQYNSTITLDISTARYFSFKGTSFFVDLSPYNFRVSNMRDEIYVRSRPCFFLNLVANTLEESKFKVFNGFRQEDVSKYFSVMDKQSQKIVQIIPNTDIKRTHGYVYEGTIYGVIGVLYNNRFMSEVIFLTDRFFMDEFGNIDDIDHILFDGDMALQRLGDMLPLNYIYNPYSPPFK